MADCILQSPPLLTYRVSDAKLSLHFFWRSGQVLPLLILTLTYPSWTLRSLPSIHPPFPNGEYSLSTKADVSRAYVAQVFYKKANKSFVPKKPGREWTITVHVLRAYLGATRLPGCYTLIHYLHPMQSSTL